MRKYDKLLPVYTTSKKGWPIIRGALTSKTLFNNDKNSWFGCIDAILQYLNVNTNYLLKSKLNVKKYLLSKLRKKYEAIWRQELFRDNSGQGYGNKLRT